MLSLLCFYIASVLLSVCLYSLCSTWCRHSELSVLFSCLAVRLAVRVVWLCCFHTLPTSLCFSFSEQHHFKMNLHRFFLSLLVSFSTLTETVVSSSCGDFSCPANTHSKPASTPGNDVASCCGCETGKQLKNNVVSFSSDDDCSACPHGYHTGGDENACSACAAGRYKDTTGGTSVAACTGTSSKNVDRSMLTFTSCHVSCEQLFNFSDPLFFFLSFRTFLLLLWHFSSTCFNVPSSLSEWKLGKCRGVR